MNRRIVGATIVGVLAAIVWSAADELPAAMRAWTTALLTLLPPLLLLQARMLGQMGEIPRSSIYGSSAISLWVLAGITVVVTVASGTSMAAIGWTAPGVAETVLWSAAIMVGGLVFLVVAHRLGLRESEFLYRILPTTPSEKLAFVGLSVTAGICEELVFRGFLIWALTVAVGSIALAVLLSSVVFGVLHAYQRPAGAVRAAALGGLLALPYLATGSVLPGVIAHAGLDIAAGLWLRHALLR